MEKRKFETPNRYSKEDKGKIRGNKQKDTTTDHKVLSMKRSGKMKHLRKDQRLEKEKTVKVKD